MNSELLLSHAEDSLKKGDRKSAGIAIHQVLQIDFINSRAWNLLYKHYNHFSPYANYEEFQVEFATKYYPDKVHLLKGGVVQHPKTHNKSQTSIHVVPTHHQNLPDEVSKAGLESKPKQSVELIYFFDCDYCERSFKSMTKIVNHINIAHPGQEVSYKVVERPSETSVSSESETTSLGRYVPAIVVVGVVLLAVFFLIPWSAIGSTISSLVPAIAFIVFFPLLFPLALLATFGILSLVFPPSLWMVNLALGLLQQKWWWFPGGQIAGFVFLLIF